MFNILNWWKGKKKKHPRRKIKFNCYWKLKLCNLDDCAHNCRENIVGNCNRTIEK